MTGTAKPARGPLSGIRVLEIGHMLAGPYCTMLLADLGADVIKIEPRSGDIARAIGPNYVGEHNVYFASLNRNKRSVCLDLTSPEGAAKFHHLVSESHALVTNLRPGAIKKLGLTYDALKEHNRNIVCAALTGYGLDGPYAENPAYDYVIQALSGVIALAGEPGGPPVKCGHSVVDNSAGMMGAVGLLAQIISGQGGQIDVSLYDVMLSQLNYVGGAYLNNGELPQRHAGGAHPYIVPAQLFATKDGHLALFITHDQFWHAFCVEVGKPEWLSDSCFATMDARSNHRDKVIDALNSLFKAGTTEDWVNRLSANGIVIAGVETLDRALNSDLTNSRDMVITIATNDGPLRLIGEAVKFGGDPSRHRPPPVLGEHDREVFGASG